VPANFADLEKFHFHTDDRTIRAAQIRLMPNSPTGQPVRGRKWPTRGFAGYGATENAMAPVETSPLVDTARQ
jgi:hypothetical protein